METSKKQIVLVPLVFLLLIFSIGSESRAGNTVRVFLLAGQSNMEGNNTTIPRLQELICHANSDFIYDSVTCGSTDIDIVLLTKFFIDNEKPLNDYYYAQSVYPNHPVVIKLGNFLCASGKLSLPGENCNTLSFDLADRFFATISGYYYHEGNQQFQWGYDAFKEMSAAMGVSDTYADGHLTADLPGQRSDVTVLQFQGNLSPDGTLSFSERSGLLSTGFGAGVDRYGPELMFGHYMGDLLDDDVLLLKVVQGGTDLRVDWKTPCSNANTNNNFTPEELAQDSLYDALITKAEDIQDPTKLGQYFPQYAGKRVRISGFVWFQGWNDGLDPLNQANYETNLRCLLNDLRSDFGEPNMPVVIAQSHVGEPDNPVQVAQAIVAAEFNHTELAITDDLSGYYHFDNAAHLVIGQRMAAKMTDLLVFGNTAPVANAQSLQMRAAEFLALPFTLAATDADGDILNYTIVSGPSNGSLSGTAPRLEYVPDSTFRGQDTFTYKAADTYADSNVATVTIEVIEENCTSAQIGGPVNGVFLHVPSHMVTADVSAYEHTVILQGEPLHESASSDPCVAGHVPWISRNDLTNKTITIDLGSASTNVPLSISFKLMPTSDTQNEIIMQSNAFVIEDDSGGVTSTYYDNGSGQTSVTNNNSTLKTRSCNHFAVVLGNSLHITYLNGYDTQQAADTSNLRNIDGTISIGPYPGKVWDIRIYERILTPTEILDLGGSDCSDDLLTPTPYPGYPNYLIGVYIDEWWPDHATESLEEFQYYLHAQDTVYERNLFEAGMYARDELCAYFDYGGPRSLELSDGIRNGFVAGWTFSNPLKQSNCDYWMHENFHSYQGNLGGYLGFGMSKFMLESGASWGPDHMVPGKRDTLLAYYSMHPHLPLWTIQNSPVDMRAGWEFKGGHQYGAYIFWSYFTNHVANKMWLGDVHSTPGHVQAAYDLLAVQGHDMAPHFGDFAARITMWDIKDGEQYAEAEEASLRRMRSAKPDAETHDNKITAFYDSNGTGNQWTSVTEKYIPGSWAFNAYKVDVNEDGNYIIGINTDVSNPPYSDFQARAVVYDKGTGERSYHTLGVAAAGEPSSIRVSALAGDELYLVVATTPDIFSGWDWYRYKFKIHPDRIPPPVAAPTNLSVIGGNNQVYLDWDDNTEPNLVGYNVFRSTTSGKEYVQIAAAVLTSEYVDSNVVGGTQYYYVVTAIDTSDNESEYSNEASAMPTDTVAPAAPGGLSARACGSQVYLDWDDNTEPDIAGYNIYRGASSGGGYVQIGADLTTSSYSDGDVDNGITYYYVVTAVDLNGNESGYSDEASATLSEDLDIACGLTGYWPFDNSAADKAGSNDGTLQGGASYVSGKLGQALACNSEGTLDYVRLNRTDSLIGDWTAAAWMNVHNQDVGGFLCGGSYDIRCPGQFGASGHPGLTDSVTNVNASWDGTDSQSQAYSLPSETWVLLVFVGMDTDANGTTDRCELFADGISQGVLVFSECKGVQGSDPSGTPIQFILTWNRIGDLDQYSGYGNAVADYDEVAVWSRALNADEIAWLYNDGEGNKIVPSGDLNLDGCVNLVDYAWLAYHWQEDLCGEGNGWCGGADLAPEIPDGVVNALDLAVVVNNWLAGVKALPGQGPGPATNPVPVNDAINVNPNADLSWTAGAGAISHDVYIGTSNPPPFISNESATTFVPGWLPYQTSIYWRIDEINDWGRTTGEVWEFITVTSPPPMPGQASNPNPADGATGVSIDQDLSWTPGPGATSHDVYFGTSMILPFIKNQAAATFEPGRMELGTKYYWRINERTTSGTIVGPLWSFTASAIPPPPP